MKRRFTIPILASALALSLALMVPAWAEGKAQSEGNVAVVNGSVISQAEFERELGVVEQRLSSMGRPVDDSQMADLKKRVLDNMINRELLYQESKKEGIKVPEAKVSEQFETLKKRFSSEEELKRVLKERDLTEADIRAQIERGLAIQELVDNKFEGKVKISDQETKAYYDSHQEMFKQPEQVRASHILIKTASGEDKAKKAEARKKIEEIQKKVKKGDDFSELAKKYSEGPSKDKGGDLGYFGRGQMVKPFEDAAFGLKEGEVSGIVESPFGYHLIKKTGEKPASTVPYDEVKGKLQDYLKQEKVQKEVAQYVEELRKKGNVEVLMKKAS
ncbi:MAG: peptidylprolyl isomerase [Deltaproteobacteria bacterium]